MRYLDEAMQIDWIHIDEHNKALDAIGMLREVLADIYAGKSVQESEIDHVLQETDEYIR